MHTAFFFKKTNRITDEPMNTDDLFSTGQIRPAEGLQQLLLLLVFTVLLTKTPPNEWL